MNLREIKKDVRMVERAILSIIGFTILVIGVILFILPGAFMIIIPLGLAVLGTQFVWARRILRKLKNETKIIEKETEKLFS